MRKEKYMENKSKNKLKHTVKTKFLADSSQCVLHDATNSLLSYNNDNHKIGPMEINQSENVDASKETNRADENLDNKNQNFIIRPRIWRAKLEKYDFADHVNIDELTMTILKNLVLKVTNGRADINADAFYTHNKEIRDVRANSLGHLMEEDVNFRNRVECFRLRKMNILFLNKMKKMKEDVEKMIDFFYEYCTNEINEKDEDFCKFKLLISDSIHRKRNMIDLLFNIRERICKILLMAQEGWHIAKKLYLIGRK